MNWLSTQASTPIVLPAEYADTSANASDLAISAFDFVNLITPNFRVNTYTARLNGNTEKLDYFWSIIPWSAGDKASNFGEGAPYWDNGAALINYVSDFEGRLQEQISLLNNKIESLARTIGDLLPTPKAQRVFGHVVDYEAELGGKAIIEPEVFSQAELFNMIADGMILPPADTIQQAISALEKGDAETRAGAGRALASINPKLAVDLLIVAIKNEKHRFVRSVLKGALRLAQE